MIKHIYVLRNKDTGKWFYEAIWGGMIKYIGTEVDTIDEVVETPESYENGYFYSESACRTYCGIYRDKHNLNLEVVRVKKTTTYEEC